MTTKIKKRHTICLNIDRDKAARIAAFAATSPIYELSVSFKSDDDILPKVQFQGWAEDHPELTKKIILLITSALN